MIRKLFAVIFLLCMVLAAAPIVQAEETGVKEIKTAADLYNLFHSGGSGKLMNEIPQSTYYDMPVMRNTDLDMNGYTINNGHAIIIGSNVTLTLRGNGEIKSTGVIQVNSRGVLNADNSVTFSTSNFGYVNLNGGTLNGGTYNVMVQGQGYEDTIQNGVFTGNIENNGGSIIINNGTFNNRIYSRQGNITINGGTFNSGSKIENSTINGGTFNGATIDPNCTITNDISKFTIPEIPDQTYSGAELTPGVTITIAGTPLVQETDYNVAYSNNHNVGTATAVITGIGKYIGTVTKTFAIKPKEVSVSGIKAQNKVYDGSTTAVLDTSSAVIDGKAEGDDVSVNASGSFEDADAGTNKKVNFTQKLAGNAAENYVLNSAVGTVTADISKADPSLSVEAVSTKTYSDDDFQLNVTRQGDGKISFVSGNPALLTVSDTGLVHIAGAGTTSITVNLAESKNYTSASDTLNITVDKATGSLSIQNDVINKTYGDDDFSVKPSDSTPGTIRYTADDSGVVSVDDNGNVRILKAGTAVVTVSMEATGNHHAVSETITIHVAKANPSLSVETVSTKTYSDDDFQLNVSHQGDGVISYSSDNTNVLTVSDTGLVHIAGAGTASITVNLAESKNYNSASDTLKITVDKVNGSLSIQNAVINKTYGDDDFSVKPSDSTPGTIRYTADDSGVVSVDDNGNVHILKVGTAVVTVSMDATGNHHAVSETITIHVAAKDVKEIKDIGTLSIPNIPDQTYSGSDLMPGVTIKKGNYTLAENQDYTVTYSNNHNAGTAAAVITGIGSYSGSVTKTFDIKPKEVSVSGIKAQNKVYDGTTTVVLDTSNAVIEGKTGNDDVSVQATGSFEDADAGNAKTVHVTQELKGEDAGNYVLNSGTGTLKADISKANPSLSVEAVSAKTYNDNDFQLNVSHQGDGKISFTSGNPAVLTVSDTGLVHIAGAGTTSITVNLAESKNYTSASDTLTITVDKATGSLSIQNAVINKTYGDPDFSVKPSDSTPGTIRYTTDGSGVVSVDENGTVHILKAGTAVVTVSMDATGNHHAVSETITIHVAEAIPETPEPVIEDKDYVITTGNKADWQRGSNKQLVIISDGDYDLFNGLYIDGSLVDRSNYEVRKGSTEIYLQPSYLETLIAGRHTFELRYSNGKTASGEFTIVEAEKSAEEKKGNKTAVPSGPSTGGSVTRNVSNDNRVNTTVISSSSPETGDNTNSVVWGFIMIAAIICAAGAVVVKKEKMNVSDYNNRT